MGKRMSIAAKERWRKTKAVMEASQNEADGPNHSAVTTDNDQSKHSEPAAFTSKRKISKVNDMIVRRSNRLKSLGSFGKRRGTEAVQHIDLTNLDRDKEPHVEPISLKPTRDVSNLEMKADGPNHSAVTTDNVQSKHSQSAVFTSKRKISKVNDMILRRSNRLKSLGSFAKRRGTEAVQHIDLTNLDRDKEPHVEPISLKPTRDVSNLEMKQADGPKSSVLTNNAQSKFSQAVSSKRKKTSKASDMLVRQSGQLKSLGSSGKRQREGVHHIDPTDCDKDMDLQVETICPKPIRGARNSETIVDYLVQTRGIRPFASETTPTNHNYKIRYTNSEKKVEALTEENYQQAQKLSYLLGKVKLYENMTGIVMNSSRGAVKLHPDAAALNSAPAPKTISPVKKKKKSVKRMKKN